MKLEYIKELTIGFMYEIMDEDKAMKKEQHVQKTNSFIEIIYAIPKQDRFGYLDVLNKEHVITDQECADALHEIWTIQECFYKCGMPKLKMLQLMKIANKSADYQEQLNRLSDEDTVEIYRGSRVNNYNGMSWTIDKNIAIWFAKRFSGGKGTGFVFAGTINKKYILEVFNNRNEKEVVCDYRKIKNIVCEEIALVNDEEIAYMDMMISEN